MRLRLFGITVDISYPLAAVMTAVIICDSSMSVLTCIIAIVIHEGGHLIALHRFGAFPRHFRLTLFDIAIVDRKKPLRGTRQELVVVLAGIASNLVFAGIFYVFRELFPCAFFDGLIAANLSLAIFNGLPVESLDGGQALFLILSEKLTMYKAMVIVEIVSFVILVPLGCIGYLILLRSVYNFSLLLTSIYLTALILMRISSSKPACRRRSACTVNSRRVLALSNSRST